MKSRWNNHEAQSYREKYAAFDEDLALRIYTSHLIGREPSLVLHGGGNTSVKSTARNILGEEFPVIYVKGSGWNLDTIEPAGFPGLDLRYLRKLRIVDNMSDEVMVNELRTHLLNASSPTPSVETLLHAFLNAKFVDHSHADAILTLTNQLQGMELIADALSGLYPVLDYVMPGFLLSKQAAELAEQHPEAPGLVLHKHGLFTYAEMAQESYERHIYAVTQAEQAVQALKKRSFTIPSHAHTSEKSGDLLSAFALELRRALTAHDPAHRNWLIRYENSERTQVATHTDCPVDAFDSGPLTPDHIIRTKEKPLVLRTDEPSGIPTPAELEVSLKQYVEGYAQYFEHNVTRTGRILTMLDPLPRVVILPGVGVFFIGATVQDIGIVGDITSHTFRVKANGASIGKYEALTQDHLFDMEYWSLEQAKLGKQAEKALQRKAALVTGAAGAIGSAIVEALLADGACVVGVDLPGEQLGRLEMTHRRNPAFLAVACDVTKREAVSQALAKCVLSFGGLDILILNAGIAYSKSLEHIPFEQWQRVFDINLNGYFHFLQAAIPAFKAQGSGGSVIINSSKNVFDPGKEFAAYSASKAACAQLGKVAALELADIGVRVNMINADGVFTHGEVPSGLWREIGPDRAKARGMTVEELPEFYRQRNLLKVLITAQDVAKAVLFFARQETPTTGATFPVDGGIPGAFPR